MNRLHASVGLMILPVLVLGVFMVRGESRATSESEPVVPPTLITAMPESVPVSASSVAVIDVVTGAAVYTAGEGQLQPIASIAKLIAASALRDDPQLDTVVVMSEADVETYGRAGRLRIGDVLTRRELLFPLLLESSNDAAAALERVTGGVMLQNQANRITLADYSGLSLQNTATADSLGLHVRDLYREAPYIFDITTLDQYLLESHQWQNNSPFIGDDTYRGGKHGFLPEAGETAAVVFYEELQSGTAREFVYVVLGSTALREDVALLRTVVRDSVDYR